MIHKILMDVAIGFGVILAVAVVLIVVGCVMLSNDEANGINPFE